MLDFLFADGVHVTDVLLLALVALAALVVIVVVVRLLAGAGRGAKKVGGRFAQGYRECAAKQRAGSGS